MPNVFYYDYRDQQIAVDNPVALGQSFTQNAGTSHLYGAEIEARARPIDSLTLFASVGLLKTKFDEAVTSTGIFTGNEFPEAPAVTAAAGGIWKHESGFFAGADVSYTDGYFSPRDLANDPLRRVSAITLVNARIGYETKHGIVTLFARNLLDRQYLTAIAQGYSEATIGDGRMFGVRGTMRF
jgi:iron complex outermembrane receptor protein